MIEYRHIHKAFNGSPALSDVTLDVSAGETVALVGPSGAGKSVLLKTTNGLIVPDSGDVRIEGRSVFGAPPPEQEAMRRQVGYVFQGAALFDSMTVHDNVALGIGQIEARALGPSEVLLRVASALRDVNLDPRQVLLRLPAELSGGMRKRVGLARAIVGRPRIVLYDEPVTGLDPVNAAVVTRLIAEIAERLRVTSVLVTHDVEGALSICDRIALLGRGRLRFVGAPADFLRSEDPLVRAFANRDVAATTPLRIMEEV